MNENKTLNNEELNVVKRGVVVLELRLAYLGDHLVDELVVELAVLLGEAHEAEAEKRRGDAGIPVGAAGDAGGRCIGGGGGGVLGMRETRDRGNGGYGESALEEFATIHRDLDGGLGFRP